MSVMHTNLEDTKEEKKQRFIHDVRYFAANHSSEGYPKHILERFALDKDLSAIWIAINDKYKELAITCKRKLEEAGIK